MTREPLFVPGSEADLTPDWLGAALATDPQASGVLWRPMERVGEEYGLSSTVVRCRAIEDGVPRSIVVKLWDIDGQAGTHEVPFYDAFAPYLGIRVPACHHGAIDAVRRRGVLVLEDLGHAVQGDCLRRLDSSGTTFLADVLAALHATWWRSPVLESVGWLPPLAVRTPESLSPRRDVFLRRFGDQLDGTLLHLVDRIEAVQSRANGHLSTAAPTLLHNDLHLDNVLFEGEGLRPVLLDWARVARGPAAIDLAELVFAIGPLDAIDSTLAAYLLGLQARGIIDCDASALRLQLGGALLRMVVQSTCGTAGWEPTRTREREILAVNLRRIGEAVDAWAVRDPDLFRF